MNRHSIPATVAAAALAVTAYAGATGPARAGAPAPHQGGAKPGTTSLAEVLAADGHHFDHNWKDFDILDAAVQAVLTAKPSSPVAVLADGTKRVTAFLPTDRAFRRLVTDLTGKRPKTERRTALKLEKLADVDTIEAVLLYHVVPGRTLTSPKVVKAAQARVKLVTALGTKVTVYSDKRGIALKDKDPNAANPHVVLSELDINKGNKQIAHGINRVLRPIDL